MGAMAHGETPMEEAPACAVGYKTLPASRVPSSGYRSKNTRMRLILALMGRRPGLCSVAPSGLDAPNHSSQELNKEIANHGALPIDGLLDQCAVA